MIPKEIILKSIDEAIGKCTFDPYVFHRKDKALIEDFKRENFREDNQDIEYDREKKRDELGKLEKKQCQNQENTVNLSDIEKEELMSYSIMNYEFINDRIYNDADFREMIQKGLVEEGDDLSLSVKRLKRAINKSTGLIEDTILYRFGIWNDLEEGSIGVWDGFTSTSYQRSVAEDFSTFGEGDGKMIKIYAPKGTKGLTINEVNRLSCHSEHEVLLGTGTRYYVLSNNADEVEILILPS